MSTKLRVPGPSKRAYMDTVDLAMERLENIEASIQQAVRMSLAQTAREMTSRRRVITHVYTSGADNIGWRYSVRTNQDLLLKRISIASSDQSQHILYVGKNGPAGVRWLSVNPTQISTPDGGSWYVSSDSFDNDIYVRAGDTLYINNYANTGQNYTYNVVLEVEEFIPYKQTVSQEEVLALNTTGPAPLPDADMHDDLPPAEEAQHFPNDDVLEAEEEDNLDVHSNDDSKPLIPDVHAHLPAHLKAALSHE